MRLLPKATVTQPSVPIKLLSRLLTARKGLIHKNNAAHKKSAMAQKMNELG